MCFGSGELISSALVSGADNVALQEEFEARAKELSAKRVGQVDSKLKAEVVAPGEWKQ